MFHQGNKSDKKTKKLLHTLNRWTFPVGVENFVYKFVKRIKSIKMRKQFSDSPYGSIKALSNSALTLILLIIALSTISLDEYRNN